MAVGTGTDVAVFCGGSGSAMRCPQDLHLSTLAAGGIFWVGILYFLLQLSQLRMIISGRGDGEIPAVSGGAAAGCSDLSFFRE